MTLLEEFLSHRLGPSGFSHQAHVEVAWGLLERFPFQEALGKFEAGVRDLSARAGAPEKYHATVTRALLQIIYADQRDLTHESWPDYLHSAPGVLSNSRELLLRHYSAALLHSEQARLTWCEPDRMPLPEANSANTSKAANRKPDAHDHF